MEENRRDQLVANFGDSFLDMAEATLGKYNRSASFEVVTKEGESTTNVSPGLKRTASDENDMSTSSDISNPQTDRQCNTSNKIDERRSLVVVTPPKRRRTIGNCHAVGAVRVLNRAMSQDERLRALEEALVTFDHNDREFHDAEIEAGADIALVKNLVLIQFKVSFCKEQASCDMEATREIGSLLKCLECVYRASSDAVGKSFDRVGNDLLQILVHMINDERSSRMKIKTLSSGDGSQSKSTANSEDRTTGGNGGPVNTGNTANDGFRCARDLMIRKATKIIGHYARVGKATRPMARFPGFLDSILQLCNIRPYSMIPFEARLSCLWAIANLACNVDNMTMMIGTPNLIDSLITIGNRRPESGDTVESIMEILRAKSIVSRTLLNLSWSLENKVHMSKIPALSKVLCRLALERQAPYKNSKTMQNVLVQTRRHALASLRNICAAPKSSKISLCKYDDGKLLDTLTDVILNETDQSVINSSFTAIHNLAIPETSEVIVNRPALVLALKNVLLEDGDDSREGERHTVKCQCASATILVLERAITPDKSSYENFRELLDTINPSNSAENTDESTSLNATAV